MSAINIVERDMSEAEFVRMNAGFDENTIEHGNPIQTSERHGFVIMDGECFVGCSSGLADKNAGDYNEWFYLTDLFIEKLYRNQGHGSAVLGKLEEKVATLGIMNIWTWTAGYEAPDFYKKRGYEIFCEMKNWYFTGHNRIGLKKKLIH